MPFTVLHFVWWDKRCDLATPGLYHVLFREVPCVGGDTKWTSNIAFDAIKYWHKASGIRR